MHRHLHSLLSQVLCCLSHAILEFYPIPNSYYLNLCVLLPFVLLCFDRCGLCLPTIGIMRDSLRQRLSVVFLQLLRLLGSCLCAQPGMSFQLPREMENVGIQVTMAVCKQTNASSPGWVVRSGGKLPAKKPIMWTGRAALFTI